MNAAIAHHRNGNQATRGSAPVRLLSQSLRLRVVGQAYPLRDGRFVGSDVNGPLL